MRSMLLLCAALALAACNRQAPAPPTDQNSATHAPGPVKGPDRTHKGSPAPAASFQTPDGTPISLAKFKGTPVLVNLWASWCAPCVKELPTLDKLAASHRDDGSLGVVAVSEDSGPQASVKAFLAKLAVTDLGAYHDPKMALSAALGPDTVLPTSILYDAQGREVWRYIGDLDWTGAQAAKLLSEASAAPKPR
jgi:thiol-disulfide isomerase/thioredoxin